MNATWNECERLFASRDMFSLMHEYVWWMYIELTASGCSVHVGGAVIHQLTFSAIRANEAFFIPFARDIGVCNKCGIILVHVITKPPFWYLFSWDPNQFFFLIHAVPPSPQCPQTYVNFYPPTCSTLKSVKLCSKPFPSNVLLFTAHYSWFLHGSADSANRLSAGFNWL